MRGSASLLALSFALSLAGGCTPVGPGTVLLAPSADRDGTDGSDGPLGASLLTFPVQARVTESVRVEVVYPSDADGWLDPSGAPWPAVVLVQGGRVGVERYRWLATHLASRGAVVLAPHHAMDLAIGQVDNGLIALDAVLALSEAESGPFRGALAADGPVLVAGHSLGGTVGAMQWVADDRITALALLASYPAEGTEVAARAGSPALSLSGSADLSAQPGEVEAGYERLAEPRWLGFVDGMGHYAWTDDATPEEQEAGGPSTRPDADTRRDAQRVLDTFFDAALLGSDEAAAALDQGAFPGVEWR